MILSCHGSVGPSLGQRGELDHMSVEIDPLNGFQAGVVQEALEMIPLPVSAAAAAGIGSCNGFGGQH